MNERIKQLAEQATTIVDTVNSQGYSSSYANFDREKFAELIVKEILVTCIEHPAWTGRMIGEQIKQHFGVEE
jgi:hypothetical protein